ncbi:MAG TPA: hypothetical protein EYQ43_06345 [Methyloprofundus sp.]|nr:hypothetical protein [Methyloprofundus sp.]
MPSSKHYILGISAFYHDSAAALICNGDILYAAQEERFTRKKHDESFPENAIKFCLQSAGINLSQVSDVVFYDKPILKFERLLETYLAYAPFGFRSFIKAMPLWLKEKLYLKKLLRQELRALLPDKNEKLPRLNFSLHHQSHAASAFFPSPYQKAAVLCIDGVGEWATTTLWQGDGNTLTPLWEINFPHSLGLLYSAFTQYCGFKVNSGEYKLMGLAPYGKPHYRDLILERVIDLKPDGSFKLNMDLFDFAVGLTMTNRRFHKLFDGPPREPESEISQKYMDLAASIQAVTEEAVLGMVKHIHDNTGNNALCLAGGVALNCVANGRLLRESPIKDVWIQPAAGDAGGSLGAALALWYDHYGNARQTPEVKPGFDGMRGSFLGPQFTNAEVSTYLDTIDANYSHYTEEDLGDYIAQMLDEGNVVGWFQGAMEFGPRALGGRSILGDARNPEMQKIMNLKIKYRESFRPFAPSVLADSVGKYFDIKGPSPYMLLVAEVAKSIRIAPQEMDAAEGFERLSQVRSLLPAITHVNDTARVQTVYEHTNPRYFKLLKAFEKRTGCSVLINTSFNVRGEPIVNTPEDAWRCFMRTEMDILVLENKVLVKNQQNKDLIARWKEETSWQQDFELD